MDSHKENKDAKKELDIGLMRCCLAKRIVLLSVDFGGDSGPFRMGLFGAGWQEGLMVPA